jgi:putative drug exporter of the RND superfamily
LTPILYAVARFCVRQRFLVLGIWVLITIGVVGFSHTLGNDTNNNLSLPGTDSQRATDALSHSFPDQANGSSPQQPGG